MKENIVDCFKKGIFLYKGNVFQTKEEKSEDESEDESEEERSKKFIEYIEKESKDLKYDLLKNYFNFVVHSSLAKTLYERKSKNKQKCVSKSNQEQME